MSISGMILGLINIAIVAAVLLLVGAVILWFTSALKFAVPELVQRLYIVVVALVALYMLVALLFGIPSIRVIGGASNFGPVGAWVAPPSTQLVR